MNKTRLSQRLVASSGQTMVDLIISLALLALATISSTTLANSSFNVGQESGRRSQASALASHELEGLRTLNDALSKQSPAQTLWSWLGTNGSTFTTSGSCRQFYMVRTTDNIGWSTSALSSGLPQAFSAADELDDSNYGNYSNFARLIQLCQMPDYSTTTHSYSGLSSKIYQVSVQVYWQEGSSGPILIPGQPYNRQLILTSIIATPGQ